MNESFVTKRMIRVLQISYLLILLILSTSSSFAADTSPAQGVDKTPSQTGIGPELSVTDHSIQERQIEETASTEPSVKQVRPIRSEVPEKTLEKDQTNFLEQGTLTVKSLGNGMGIQTDVEVWSLAPDANLLLDRVASGITNDEGIFLTNLEPGRYIAKVHGAVTQSSEVLTVKPSENIEFVAEFVSMEIVPYSFGEPAPSSIVEISGDAQLELELTPMHKEVLWVTPGTYSLKGVRQQVEIKLNGFEMVPIDITLDAVTFGQLEIYANTSDNMPISANYIVYNATSGAQVTSGVLGTDGFVSMNLAPGDYDIETFLSDTTNRITNSSVTIIGEQTTAIHNTLSQYIVYSNVTTWIYAYDELDRNVASAHRGSNDINVVFYLPAGIAYDFTLSTPGTTYYNISSIRGEKVIVGSAINDAPYFVSSPTSASRVNANQSTIITAQVFDRNYDFPLTLDRVVSFGTTTIVSSGWVATNIFEFQVNYTAPIFEETYRLDLAVVDTTNLYSNFTLYLSNRQSTVNLNSTGFNDRPLAHWIYAYDRYSGATKGSAYTGTTGETSMVLDDGEYYFIWSNDLSYTSPFYSINATYTPYSIHYRWAEVNINMTGMYGQALGGTARIYDASDLSSQLLSRSVSSSIGSTSIILPAGNYSIKTFASTESSPVWHFGVRLNATERPSVVSSFGVLAVYQFDVASNPEAVWTYLYNATNSLSVSIASAYTGTSGIATYNLAPYSNYTLKSSRSATEWYYNLTVLAGDVTVIGNFTNSAPVISDITASPRRIGPNDNTTVTVTATDVDPIDVLTYTWTVTEGTISGSGNQVTYFSPSTLGTYKIEVNVTDQFGGWSNTTIWVSSNVGSIDVTVTQGGSPYARWIYIYDGITGSSVSSAYSGGSGFATFTSIYPGPYEVRVTGTNVWSQFIFVNGGGTDAIAFGFATITFNTTSANDEGISANMKVYLNSSGSQEFSVSTSSSTGLATATLRPDLYDFEASSDGTSIRSNAITVVADEVSTYDFRFGRISLDISSGYGKPFVTWTYLYQNSGSSISAAYSSNGIATYDVAPGTYNLSLPITPSDWVYDIVVAASADTPVVYQLGVLAVYTNDGTTALSQLVAVYSGGTLVFSEISGSDGFVIRDMAPGTYDVLVDGTIWTNNVVITGGQRTQVGTRLNRAPVIVSVASVDVGPSTTQTVTVTATDSDYDYEYLYLNLEANVGTLSAVGAFSAFTSAGDFEITFDYTSPSTVDVYRVNITLYDSFGGNDSYVLYLSNNVNPVHLYSYIDNFTPRNTQVTIYDSISGATVTSFALGTGGYGISNLVDGLYDIRFQEDTAIWLYSMEIVYGGYYNFSAYFGVVDIYVTTTGGAPVAAWTYAYDHPRGGSSVAAKYTGSDGIATYILAPGTYEFDIIQTNTITIIQTVEGGVKSVIGNDVPVLTDPPADLTYTFGDIGNYIAWNFTDATPDYYNITMDGVTIDHGAWNGSILTINVDGLYPGTYMFIIYVNDTNGLPNQDTVFVTVLPTSAPLINPHGDATVEASTSLEVSWVVNGENPDMYVVYLDGVVFETGSWTAGFVNVTFAGLAIGSYNLTLMINDTLGQVSVDQFMLTLVDTTAPTVIHSGDMTYVAGQTGNVISFTPYDSFAPGTYTVTIDGAAGSATAWANATSYQINVDGLSIGIHTVVIDIVDANGNAISVTISVTVQDPAITLVSGPLDGSFDAPADVDLTWTFSAVEISTYTIYLNGTEVATGSVPDDTTVSHSLVGLEAGVYNVTVYVQSAYGTELVDTVILTVNYVGMPSFTSVPADLAYVNVTSGNSLTWQVADATWYEIYVDGTLVEFGTLPSSIVVNVDGLPVGEYNITVVIGDDFGNEISDTAIVTVIDPTIIILSSPSDSAHESPAEVPLEWVLDGYMPFNFTVYYDGVIALEGENWVDNVSFIVFLETGTHNVTIVFFNSYGAMVTDTVILNGIDTSSPTFTSVPSDLEYVEGTLGHTLTWQFSDAYLDYYEVEIDGIMVSNGSISNTSLTLNVDGFAAGSHNVTLSLWDKSGNMAMDMANILVTEAHHLEIVASPSSMLLGENVNETVLKWKVDSSHPDTYTVEVNGVVMDSNTFTDEIEFTFPHSGPGLYEITLTVSDINGTQVSDTVYVLVVQGSAETSSQSAPLNAIVMVLTLIALAIPALRRKEVRV